MDRMPLDLGKISVGDNAEESGRFAVSWLTLRFHDRKVENAYAYNDIKKALPLIRVTLAFAVIVYASFGVLDYYLVDSVLTEIWTIRLGVVCPVMFVGFLTTLSPNFWQFAQKMLGFCMLTAGLGIVAMTALIPPPTNAEYYAGLILVVIYGSTLVRMTFVNSAVISVVLVMGYQFVAIWINPLPAGTLLSNNYFLLVASGLGIFGSYIQELYVRFNYVSTRLLIEEKGRSEQLLAKSEAANHAKSEFLAVVSHELRTPLNAIIGFSEFLKMEMFGPLGSGRYKSYSEDIYRSGQHLLHIINDILDLSRAEANKLEVTEQQFSLGEMINNCLRMFRNKAAEEGIQLSFKISEDLNVRADQRLMNQVLINLLSNAVKFTANGGSIEVTAFSDEDDRCSVRVTDTGIGIAEENIMRVLEPFIQVESATARSHEGLGLGLPLVKRIMNLHGGTVEIESSLGRGTSVTVTLPGWRRAEWDQSDTSNSSEQEVQEQSDPIHQTTIKS